MRYRQWKRVWWSWQQCWRANCYPSSETCPWSAGASGRFLGWQRLVGLDTRVLQKVVLDLIKRGWSTHTSRIDCTDGTPGVGKSIDRYNINQRRPTFHHHNPIRLFPQHSPCNEYKNECHNGPLSGLILNDHVTRTISKACAGKDTADNKHSNGLYGGAGDEGRPDRKNEVWRT